MSPHGFDKTFKFGDQGAVLDDLKLISVAVDPASLAAGTTANTDVALPAGTAAAGARVFVEPPDTLEHGLVCIAASISATDTLRLRISNLTAGVIDGASRTWRAMVISVG